MIVVSEIGEQWSPHTAPARQEAIEITIICPSGNTPITIGIRMLKVPQDVSIIGINDMETVCYLDPMLTTIHVPLEEMGHLGVKLLIDRIEGGHTSSIKVDVPFTLIQRESCGPAKKRY